MSIAGDRRGNRLNVQFSKVGKDLFPISKKGRI